MVIPYRGLTRLPPHARLTLIPRLLAPVSGYTARYSHRWFAPSPTGMAVRILGWCWQRTVRADTSCLDGRCWHTGIQTCRLISCLLGSNIPPSQASLPSSAHLPLLSSLSSHGIHTGLGTNFPISIHYWTIIQAIVPTCHVAVDSLLVQGKGTHRLFPVAKGNGEWHDHILVSGNRPGSTTTSTYWIESRNGQCFAAAARSVSVGREVVKWTIDMLTCYLLQIQYR